MLTFLATFLVACLGSEDWETRERAQVVLQRFINETDDTVAVQEGLGSDDPEVVRRCHAILAEFDSHAIPTGLVLLYMDHDLDRELWVRANTYPYYQDATQYARLLLLTRKITGAELRSEVTRAHCRQTAGFIIILAFLEEGNRPQPWNLRDGG